MKEMHVRRSPPRRFAFPRTPSSDCANGSASFPPLLLIIEAGLPQSGTKCAIQSRWFAYGVIDGSRVCIVLTQDRPGVFTVITGFCC